MRNKIQDVMARRAAGEKGFTLIELLVVVIILVILAAVAIPIFLNQSQRAQEAADQSNLATVAQTIKNGQGLNAPVRLGVYNTAPFDTFPLAAGQVGYVSSAGNQSVMLGGADLNVAINATPVDVAAGALVPATFCITQGGFQMTAATSEPVPGTCIA